MKRRLLMMVLLLVAGAIVNVAVAWGCARSANNDFEDREWLLDTPLLKQIETAYGIRSFVVSARRTSNMRMLEIRGRCEDQPCIVQHLVAGWPMFALSGAKIAVAGPRSRNALVSARTDWAIGFGDWDQKVYANVAQVLPLRPLWPGCAINTVFYAAILWLLFAAPFALRRRRRIKRGLCPKCAYDLRSSASDSQTCPECGASR